MELVTWVLQIVVFLALWKAAHLLFWNLRKMIGSTTLLLAMLITLLIAVLAVVLAHAEHAAWAEVMAYGLLLGVANGEYEYNRGLGKDRNG